MPSLTKDDKWRVNAKDVLHRSCISQDKTCLIQTIAELLSHRDLDKQKLEQGLSLAYILYDADLWILYSAVQRIHTYQRNWPLDYTANIWKRGFVSDFKKDRSQWKSEVREIIIFSGSTVIIQENGEYSFCITALRIDVLNACSQYPKYQSVSIITISSRRDPNASPLISAVSYRQLQRPSVIVLFITHFFLQQLHKRSRNQTKDRSTKAGQVVKPTATDLPQIQLTRRDLLCQGL